MSAEGFLKVAGCAEGVDAGEATIRVAACAVGVLYAGGCGVGFL